MTEPNRRRAVGRSDCIFCKIIAGDMPSRRIYADDHAVAFLDIGPGTAATPWWCRAGTSPT